MEYTSHETISKTAVAPRVAACTDNGFDEEDKIYFEASIDNVSKMVGVGIAMKEAKLYSLLGDHFGGALYSNGSIGTNTSLRSVD